MDRGCQRRSLGASPEAWQIVGLGLEVTSSLKSPFSPPPGASIRNCPSSVVRTKLSFHRISSLLKQGRSHVDPQTGRGIISSLSSNASLLSIRPDRLEVNPHSTRFSESSPHAAVCPPPWRPRSRSGEPPVRSRGGEGLRYNFGPDDISIYKTVISCGKV